MGKRILCVILACVTLFFCVNVGAFGASSAPEVKNFKQTSATASSVTLKWDKASKAKGYRLYMYDKKSGEYKTVGFFSSASATVEKLSAAKSYKFRIKAYIKENGKKIYSKNFTYLTAVTAPDKVTGLKVSEKKKSSFVLSWDKVKGADGYIIQKLNPETDKWKNCASTTALSKKLTTEGKYRVLSYKLSGDKKITSAASSKVTGKFKYVYSESGTFTFTVYGYGHGVGLSQTGAIYLAGKGWSYKKILRHYFTSATVVTDKAAPDKVTYGGKKYSLKQYLYRVTQAEIGSAADLEVIKTQVVACYSYAKYYNFKIASYEHAFSDKSKVSDKVKEAVDAVIGQYVSYNGKVCLTPYFHISAGKTASCESTWGGKLPYLSSVSSSCDKKAPGWKTTYKISSEDFKERFLKVYDIELKGDPSKWIKIISHDDAVSSSIGYVSQISVGDTVMKGDRFRSKVMNYSLRSHCFTVSYKAD